MRSDAYWQSRSEQRLIEAEQLALRAENEMGQYFAVARQNIDLQISQLYAKYAKDNKLEYADALQYLANNERKEFQAGLKEYLAMAQNSKLRDSKRQLLQALSTRARVQRLEVYKANLDIAAGTLYRQRLEPAARRQLGQVLQDGYYKTIFDASQGLGYQLSFRRLPQNTLDALLEFPWSGKNFSQKWSDNCENFQSILSETLTKGLVAGWDSEKMARELRDRTGKAFNKAKRLVRTETNFIHGEGTARAYEQFYVEKYGFLATLDIDTSIICRSLDGKVFLLSERKTGVNYAPMHPFCRSTSVPKIYEDEEDDNNTRFARDANGKPIRVPANMTYEEWAKKYHPIEQTIAKKDKLPRPVFVEKLDLRNKKLVQSKLEKYEAILRKKPEENAYVILKGGKVYRIKGDLNGVHPEVLGKALKGAIVTHNHPVGSANEYSFSDLDINMFMDFELKTLRGVDELYQYEISRLYQDVEALKAISDIGENDARHESVKIIAKQLEVGYRRKRYE